MEEKILKELLANFSIKNSSPNSFCVERDDLFKLISFLKNNGYLILSCITAIDWQDYFEVIYHLDLISQIDLITIKVKLDKTNPSILSITAFYNAADFLEREVFDMFGITFTNHPNLQRILMPEDCDYFPLRKDFNDKN